MSLESVFRAMWFRHELWRSVQAAVAAEDRDWFDAHPRDNERWRPYVTGEGDSDSSFFVVPPEQIVVQSFRDGARVFHILHPIGPAEPDPAPPAAYQWDWDDEDSDAA